MFITKRRGRKDGDRNRSDHCCCCHTGSGRYLHFHHHALSSDPQALGPLPWSPPARGATAMDNLAGNLGSCWSCRGQAAAATYRPPLLHPDLGEGREWGSSCCRPLRCCRRRRPPPHWPNLEEWWEVRGVGEPPLVPPLFLSPSLASYPATGYTSRRR